jgi:hypothetical protein
VGRAEDRGAWRGRHVLSVVASAVQACRRRLAPIKGRTDWPCGREGRRRPLLAISLGAFSSFGMLVDIVQFPCDCEALASKRGSA